MPQSTFDVRTDRSLIRESGSSTRFLLARVVAPPATERDYRMPVNVSFVLDRSGSMADARKFTLAREAVEQALRMLRREDRFAFVVYDTEIDVLANSAFATEDAKRTVRRALAEIGPRGGTDLSGGWLRGCEQVAEFMDRGSIGRCFLLTDGLANHGIRDRGLLAEHASGLRNRGVSTSTFGLGSDFDERLLRDMAHGGGGNFHYIEGAAQIPSILTGELGEALEVTMRDVAIELSVPHGVRAEPLNRFRHQRSPVDGTLRIEFGDLVSRQEIAAVVKLEFPAGEPMDDVRVRMRLRSGSTNEPIGEAAITWRFASHRDNDGQPRDVIVDRELAALFAARARAEAAEANRDGDLSRARRVLDRTVERVRQYAGTDPELGEIWQRLREDVPRYAGAAMSPMALKSAFSMAESMTKGRSPSGFARRAVKQSE